MASAINNYQESLALTEFVALTGVFPARNQTGDDPGTGDTPIGVIRTFAGNFAPGSDALAAGQLLAINQNTPLFSLFGNTYGGNSQTTFALPNLQARTPIGVGQGNGLDDHALGVLAGSPQVNLTQAQLPRSLGGDSQPFDNEQPSLPVTYIIRTTGNTPTVNGGGAKFIGEIMQFASNFAPAGFMEAAGQVLAIASHEALFGVIGTAYGGDGLTTFALPDLRGRNAVGVSNADPIGAFIGSEQVLLDQAQLPTDVGGTGQAFGNEGPGLALNYIISLQGPFPPRGDGGSAPSDSPYLGEVTVFAGNFAPRGWALCQGQLLAINTNQALFALLGNTYGGDGRTTFALPDLRGRTVVGTSDDVPVGTVLGIDDQHLLPSDIPDVTVTGTAAGEALFGGGGNDHLSGAGGADTLTGNDGSDVLNGGAGADTMRGDGGNDVYYVDGSGDKVDESAADANGIDTVVSAISFSLLGSARVLGDIERVVLSGAGNINAAGNALVNTLTGNSGANVLAGRGGADVLQGLLGNDVYALENGMDAVVDTGGIDTITSTITRSLASYPAIEQLALVGTAAINGIGNNAANVIVGNTAANVLYGGIGNDVLSGGNGNDAFSGGNGNDRLFGGAGNDRLVGGLNNDFFVFNTALNASANRDAITDFYAPQDTFQLENAIFTRLGAGVHGLNPAFFRAGAAALDANDYVVYNRASGLLSYDPNGDAAGGAIAFAVLVNKPVLAANDFVVI